MPDLLWLGAHKTGTTYLQSCLEASRQALQEHGVAYAPLETFRQAHTRPLLDRPAPLTDRPSPKPASGLRLVFDENILGLVQNVCTPEGLYPEGPWRADEMADRLQLDAPHLVLGLRNLAGFLPSLYCEMLKSTPFQPFRDTLRSPWEKLSWQPLVAGLLRAFPDSGITLYTAERLRGRETQLLSQLLRLPPEAIRHGATGERPGFSQRAVTEMEAAQAAGNLTPRQVKALAAAYPRGPEAPGFDPWTPAERTDLDARWQADLAALRGWDRVRWLDLP